MINVDVYTGFLGAGKTTLITKMLKDVYKNEKVVLLENEFGEVGIDGGFLKESSIEITELNSGCICCSLAGDLGDALKMLAETYHPDRIIVEPSGVGKLSDVVSAIMDSAEELDLKISAVCAVVDAAKCRVYLKNFAEFYENQIENAGTIVLSRSQNLSDEKLDAVVKLIREHNSEATIITTPWDEIDGEIIFSAMLHKPLIGEIELHNHHDDDCECEECAHGHEHEHHHHHHGEDCDCDECHDEHHHHHHHEHGEDCDCHDHQHHDHEHGHDHHHHHADEVFQSIGFETTKRFSEEELKNMLSKLSDMSYGMVLRAKGIVNGEDGKWIHFDYVPGEMNIRNGGADYTGRLCVIGSALDEESLKELFEV